MEGTYWTSEPVVILEFCRKCNVVVLDRCSLTGLEAITLSDHQAGNKLAPAAEMGSVPRDLRTRQ